MEIRTVTVDVDAIFNRHYMNALNDETGSMSQHWRKALDEILEQAGVLLVEPVKDSEADAPELKTAAELAMGDPTKVVILNVPEGGIIFGGRLGLGASGSAKGA